MGARLVVGGLVVLAGLALALSFFLSSDRSPGPLGYRVVYEVDDLSGDEPRTSTEVLEVRKPYDSRVEIYEGSVTDGRVSGGQVTNRLFQWTLGEGGDPSFGIARPPGPPERDLSQRPLEDAVDAGLAEKGEERTLRGTRCQTYVWRRPYPNRVEPGDDRELVEACVTSDGILIEETWRLGGQAVRVTRATEIEPQLELSDERFLIGREPSGDETSRFFSERLRVNDEQDPPGNFLRPRLPRGFTIDRTTIVTEQPAQGIPGSIIYFESYVDGPELAFVEQGTSFAGPPWGTEGVEVELGEVGPGLVVFFADHVEVRISGGGDFVRVWARSRSRAVELAESLAPVDQE